MSCGPVLLDQAALSSGLPPEELRVLAGEVEEREFAPFERICRGGGRISDGVARFGRAYVGLSLWLEPQGWDPYPFLLLNLLLSMLAAVQARVIVMSQNRLDAKDRLRSEMDFGGEPEGGNGDRAPVREDE
jgi:hypothetical protein